MYLPRLKIREGQEYQLRDDFHSKLDAKRALIKVRNENGFFAKKRSFIFSSQNPKIAFSHGVYEEVWYAEPVKQN
jgi:hypothetical protein